MNGTEIRQIGNATFHIEQMRLLDRIPGFHAKANPLLWWVEARDKEYFGNDDLHGICGGTRTKKDALRAIDDHLRDKARTEAHHERMRMARGEA